MNTAIINISDPAESTVRFTAVCVCVLCVVSDGHIDGIVLSVFVFVRYVGYVVCWRVFVLIEKIYMRNCLFAYRPIMSIRRRYGDIRISTSDQ